MQEEHHQEVVGGHSDELGPGHPGFVFPIVFRGEGAASEAQTDGEDDLKEKLLFLFF